MFTPTRANGSVYSFKNTEDSMGFYQTPFRTVLFVIVFVGFLSASIITHRYTYIVAWLIIFGGSSILSQIFIHFFKQDAKREGQLIHENGSVWKGNKQIFITKKSLHQNF